MSGVIATIADRVFRTGSAKVLHQHQLAAGLIDLGAKNPSAVWRDTHAAALRSYFDRFLKVGHGLDLIRGEAQEPDRGGFFSRNEIQAVIHNGQGNVVVQTIKNLSSLSTSLQNLPQAGGRQGFRVVKIFAVRRLEWREATVLRHLDRISAVRGKLEYLLHSSARRVEVDPPAIVRPAWVPVVGRMRGHALGLSARRGHNPDVE